MSAFNTFASHPFGSWVINGLSVVAFIIVLKILVSRLPDNKPANAVKTGVNIV